MDCPCGDQGNPVIGNGWKLADEGSARFPDLNPRVSQCAGCEILPTHRDQLNHLLSTQKS
jgi:hypothetical protein